MKHTRQLSTHSRVVKELLTRYRDTFTAFCELLNTSLQARATRIELVIDYTGNSASRASMTRIEVTDNGQGVAVSEFGGGGRRGGAGGGGGGRGGGGGGARQARGRAGGAAERRVETGEDARGERDA